MGRSRRGLIPNLARKPDKISGWADPATAKAALRDRTTRRRSRSNPSPNATQTDSGLPCDNARIVFRDVTNRTNRRTVIASLMRPEVILTNKATFIEWAEPNPKAEAFLLGTLCSTPLDWYARQIVELALNFYIFNGFPIPNFHIGDERCARVVRISGMLAAVDDRYEAWAAAAGVPVGSIKSESKKSDLLAELDAVIAHLYGLDVSDLETIWDTFHSTVDHLPDLEKVVGYFEEWSR